MGFGAGTLLSAIAYELVPESDIHTGTVDAVKTAGWLLLGALVYYAGDRLRLVAWHTPKAAYWVSNTLLQTLSEKQMLAIARSTRPCC